MTMSIRRALILVAMISITACASPANSPAPTDPAPSATVAADATTPLPAASPAPTSGPTPLDQARYEIVGGDYRYDLTEPEVTMTVPDGWLLTETFPRHFGLRPTEFLAENSVRTWYDMRVASRDATCPEAQDPAFGHTAPDILEAFVTRPGVVATTPEPLDLGGLDGHWFDVRVDAAWSEPCPFTGDAPATTLFVHDEVPDENAFWGLAGLDERMRIFVIDDGAGSNILITIDAVDEATFDRLLAAAMPVIATFEFGSTASD